MTVLRQAGEARAVAETQATAAEATLAERVAARSDAVGRLQRFAATGLLSAALPDLDLPDLGVPWTIDPALNLARRVEQALANRADSDEAWAAIQRRVSEDLTELQRALTAWVTRRRPTPPITAWLSTSSTRIAPNVLTCWPAG